jgi:hypothetical protein
MNVDGQNMDWIAFTARECRMLSGASTRPEWSVLALQMENSLQIWKAAENMGCISAWKLQHERRKLKFQECVQW